MSDEKMLLTDNEDTRRLFESCQLKSKTVVNPIIDWTDRNVWDVIENENIHVCELYKMGYERIGCIGCPIAKKKQREREFYDFPHYKQSYIKSFDRMIKARNERGKPTKWSCGEEVFLWWMEDDNIPGQMSFEDFPEVMPE